MAQETGVGRALEFSVTYDYRCPFARNVHEYVIAGLEAGAPWDVTFSAFSLHQVHVGAGAVDVWDDPSRSADLLAMQAGIAVRDLWPERFLSVHRALFAARHDRGFDLRDEGVLRRVLREQEVDDDAVLGEIAQGGPLESWRKEHEWAAREHGVFGVPTVIVEDQTAFIRLMTRPEGDAQDAVPIVERLVDLVAGWPELNELKHSKIPR